MKLIVFPQYAKLVSFVRAIASACAAMGAAIISLLSAVGTLIFDIVKGMSQ